MIEMEDEEGFLYGEEEFRPRNRSRCGGACITMILLLVVGISLLVIFGMNWKGAFTGVPPPKSDALWFPSTGSESCIRLMDLDDDGLDDVIVAMSEVTAITNGLQVDQNRSIFCAALKVEAPCSGLVYGIRGYDFKVLWSFRVKQSIFELVCDTIDVNKDGRRDCLGAGRQATLVAFDPRVGEVFWRNDGVRSRHPLWNFYNPLILPVDLDGDGVNDLVISHGGNPTIPSEVHEREAGCLLLISTRTGQQMGEPFWMPDGKETYMSPVLYGNLSVLFGTGGETVPGALYSISIDNIRQPENRFVTLVQSLEKGIMVPPIVVDMNDDGTDDILVSGFDGTLTFIEGKSWKPLWTRIFDGFEYYASPTPGDFNGDGFVDFMLIINHGEWDKYDYSQVIVVDGLTGHTIWLKNNTFEEFTSPLTLQMTRNGRDHDGFIYRQRGRATDSQRSNASTILFHGVGLQDGEIAKDERFTLPKPLSSCDGFSLNSSIVNIYLTDIGRTQLLAVIYPPLAENHLCTNFEPMERSGGALGDLNGDGLLETVDITTFITKVTSHTLHDFVAHSVLTRFSIDIKQTEPQMVAQYQSAMTSKTADETLLGQLRKASGSPSISVRDDDVRLRSKQTWNAYLGRYANSHYDRQRR